MRDCLLLLATLVTLAPPVFALTNDRILGFPARVVLLISLAALGLLAAIFVYTLLKRHRLSRLSEPRSRRADKTRLLEQVNMPQVLHLYSDRKWTGPAESVVNLCRELRSQYSVTLIHETSKKRPVYIARMAIEREVPVATPLYLRKHHSLIHVAIDVPRLVSYIKKQRVQLIHVHRLGDHMVGGPAGRATLTPVVRTLYSEAANLSLGEKWMLSRFTNGLIVPNAAAQASVLKALKAFRAKIWVVLPGIDTARFDPQRMSRESARKNLGIGPEEYVVGIASRIRSERKVGVAVEAFGIAQKKLTRLRLVIMGSGKKAISKNAFWNL